MFSVESFRLIAASPKLDDKPPARTAGKLLQSGIIYSAANFLTLGIGYGFQAIVSRHLRETSGDYGLVLTTITFIGFLGLPLAIATQAITHYIARFHFSGDDARLHGLLAGCRKFLFYITVAGSVVAILFVKPLGDFFKIPRASLTFIALVCVLTGLWGSYLTVICQGLGWFKRLALIGLLAAILRILFGGLTTRIWPTGRMGRCRLRRHGAGEFGLVFLEKGFPAPDGSRGFAVELPNSSNSSLSAPPVSIGGKFVSARATCSWQINFLPKRI